MDSHSQEGIQILSCIYRDSQEQILNQGRDNVRFFRKITLNAMWKMDQVGEKTINRKQRQRLTVLGDAEG